MLSSAESDLGTGTSFGAIFVIISLVILAIGITGMIFGVRTAKYEDFTDAEPRPNEPGRSSTDPAPSVNMDIDAKGYNKRTGCRHDDTSIMPRRCYFKYNY